jgi:hypothetical protein
MLWICHLPPPKLRITQISAALRSTHQMHGMHHSMIHLLWVEATPAKPKVLDDVSPNLLRMGCHFIWLGRNERSNLVEGGTQNTIIDVETRSLQSMESHRKFQERLLRYDLKEYNKMKLAHSFTHSFHLRELWNLRPGCNEFSHPFISWRRHCAWLRSFASTLFGTPPSKQP